MIIPTLNVMSHGVVLLAMIGILLAYDPVMAIATACVLGGFYLAIFLVSTKKTRQDWQELYRGE